MRDAVNLAKAGHPVVLFVNGPFEQAARAHAKALGQPGLDIYVSRQFDPGNISDAVEEEKALEAAAEFPSLLLSTNTRT